MCRNTTLKFNSLCELTLFVLVPLLSGCPIGDPTFFADGRLPNRVQELSFDAQQRGLSLEDVHQQLLESYGQPALTGDSSEQWAVDGGVLTFDSVAGLSFVTDKSEMIRVIRNRNPLRESIVGSYEMSTRPTSEHQNEYYWLGDVELRTSNTYAFTDSGQFPEQRFDQSENFFMLHPNGTFNLTYLNGYDPTTLLESIRGHETVARLTFRSPDGSEREYLVARQTRNHLAFESNEELEFEMEMWWNTN
jgi:hypothetical protein